MKSKRSLRFFSNTLTAAGLALAVSACSTVYQDEWNQSSGVPDLNEPTTRSDSLLAYCKKLHARGDLNLAVGICNRSHEINPTNPAPLIALGQVLEDLEMTGSAEEAYRAALLLDPQQTDALYGLGKIYIDQQRYDLAMEPLEAAAHSKSEDPRIYNALGVIMDQQGQHADAQTYYHEGLSHSPRNISLRNNLGLSMVLNGEPEAGLAMLRDVAAEPAAGAAAGRNLEMASQIAAQNILTEPADSLSAADTETTEQVSEVTPSPRDGVLWPTQELSSLSPSATAEESKADASEPLPLLDPFARHDVSGVTAAPASTPTPKATPKAEAATRPATMPRHTRSLDQELADAMTPQPQAESHTQVAEVVDSEPPATSKPTTTSPVAISRAESIEEAASETAPRSRRRPFLRTNRQSTKRLARRAIGRWQPRRCLPQVGSPFLSPRKPRRGTAWR